MAARYSHRINGNDWEWTATVQHYYSQKSRAGTWSPRCTSPSSHYCQLALAMWCLRPIISRIRIPMRNAGPMTGASMRRRTRRTMASGYFTHIACLVSSHLYTLKACMNLLVALKYYISNTVVTLITRILLYVNLRQLIVYLWTLLGLAWSGGVLSLLINSEKLKFINGELHKRSRFIFKW